MALRLLKLKTAITLGLLAGFLLSPKLWLSARFYPATPILSFLKPLSFPLDYAVFVGMLLCLCVAGLLGKPSRPIAAFLMFAVALAMLDQSRWQPWFYQFLFMLAALGLALRSRAGAAEQQASLNTCRLIVVSVYFWSGLQKANGGFLNDVFPWLMEPFSKFFPWISRFGIIVPVSEVAIGLALLTKRYRKAGVLLAIGMHAFILLAIGPWGQNRNSVVWSWNIVMAFCVFVLFWQGNDFTWKELLWPKTAFHCAVLVLFTLAPSLSFINLWDNYLSWALYAGNKNDASLYISDAVDDKLPEQIEQFTTEENPNLYKLNITRWSEGELNVPAYPELRIYKNIARTICGYAAKPSEVTLVVRGKLALFDNSRESSFDCSTLAGQR
jgi:hypothetical protein